MLIQQTMAAHALTRLDFDWRTQIPKEERKNLYRRSYSCPRLARMTQLTAQIEMNLVVMCHV